MRILLIEDEDGKAEAILELVHGVLEGRSINPVRARSFNSALGELVRTQFDLVIGDLLIPQRDGDSVSIDVTDQLVEFIANEPGARFSKWIVISRFESVASSAREAFARCGVTVIVFDSSDEWKALLRERVLGLSSASLFDFCIVCALQKERTAYRHVTEGHVGEMFRSNGLDCREYSIGALQGVIVLSPGMGMIDASITATRALVSFRPKLLAMSGVCGGKSGTSAIGDLVIASEAWNYQSGKITDGEFNAEPSFFRVPSGLRIMVSQMIEDDSCGRQWRLNLGFEELQNCKVLIAPMASGSQVVADTGVLEKIWEQHRKVAAIDMEMFGVYAAAASFYEEAARFIGAKVVVDLADTKKGDLYHEYGSVVSARFLTAAIRRALL
jgi:adenosylhomocysteine nucleosidase